MEGADFQRQVDVEAWSRATERGVRGDLHQVRGSRSALATSALPVDRDIKLRPVHPGPPRGKGCRSSSAPRVCRKPSQLVTTFQGCRGGGDALGWLSELPDSGWARPGGARVGGLQLRLPAASKPARRAGHCYSIIKRNYFQKIFIKPCFMSVLGLQSSSCVFFSRIFYFFLPDQSQKRNDNISNLKTQAPRQGLEPARLPRRLRRGATICSSLRPRRLGGAEPAGTPGLGWARKRNAQKDGEEIQGRREGSTARQRHTGRQADGTGEREIGQKSSWKRPGWRE